MKVPIGIFPSINAISPVTPRFDGSWRGEWESDRLSGVMEFRGVSSGKFRDVNVNHPLSGTHRTVGTGVRCHEAFCEYPRIVYCGNRQSHQTCPSHPWCRNPHMRKGSIQLDQCSDVLGGKKEDNGGNCSRPRGFRLGEDPMNIELSRVCDMQIARRTHRDTRPYLCPSRIASEIRQTVGRRADRETSA